MKMTSEGIPSRFRAKSFGQKVHLAAAAAVECTAINYGESIWANMLTSYSLLNDTLATGVQITERRISLYSL